MTAGIILFKNIHAQTAFSYELKHLSSYPCLEKPFYISSKLFFDRMKEVRLLRAYLRYKWLWLSENIISLEEDRVMFGKILKKFQILQSFFRHDINYIKNKISVFLKFFSAHTHISFERENTEFLNACTIQFNSFNPPINRRKTIRFKPRKCLWKI